MKTAALILRGKIIYLYIEKGATLKNSTINFCADNSVVYLSKNSHRYILNISVNNDCTVYFGKDCYFNSTECVHSWKEEQTQQYAVMDTDEWIYEKDENTVSLNDIDIALKSTNKAEERLDAVKKYLVNYTHKNRFFIEPIEVKKKKRFFNKH